MKVNWLLRDNIPYFKPMKHVKRIIISKQYHGNTNSGIRKPAWLKKLKQTNKQKNK